MSARPLATVIVVVLALTACGGGADDPLPTDAPLVDTPELDAPPDAPTDAPEADATPDAIDATTDASTADGSPIACNPLLPVGQQGCIPGQKCTWIRVQDTPEPLGRLGCVPDGSVALGGACTQGASGNTTGYDDCAAGGICIGGTCMDVCGFDGSPEAACGPDDHCVRYGQLFANGEDDPIAGACTPRCDPITQLQSNGASCGANRGCYLLTTQTDTVAICAGAGSTIVRQEIVGAVYANSCVPGAQPRRRDSSSTVMECGGLCRPADVTSTTNMTSEGGVAPDSCQQRWGRPSPGDPDGESCRYWWAREPFDTLSPYSNTVGWCFRHGAHLYDSDLNGTLDLAFPRCVSLTTGDVEPPVMNPPGNDALHFWCIATPQMLARVAQRIGREPAMREPRHDTLAPPW